MVLTDIDREALGEAEARRCGRRFGARCGARASRVRRHRRDRRSPALVGCDGPRDSAASTSSSPTPASPRPRRSRRPSLELWQKNMTSSRPAISWSRREAFRLMKAQGWAARSSSSAARTRWSRSAGAAAYCTAKAAALHLARCLALEGAPHGIRVNVVNPDAVLRGSRIWYGRVAGGARRGLQDRRAGAGGVLPRAQPAEAQRLSRGHRRGRAISSPPSARPSRPATSSTSTPATPPRSRARADRSRRRLMATNRTGCTRARIHDRGRLRRRTEPRARGAAGARLRRPRARSSAGAASTSRRSRREVAAFAVAVPSWGVGTGGTRFGALSRARRAAQHLREARGLRGDPAAGAGDAHASRRTSPGTGPRTTARCAEPRRELGPRLRRRELQHLPGPAGPDAVATSSARLSHTDPAVARGRRSRTISSASRSGASSARKALTVWIGDGTNFPGQQNLGQRLRALSGEHGARSTRRCPTTGGCSSSTSSTSPRSTRP